jgi:hypothetical protein
VSLSERLVRQPKSTISLSALSLRLFGEDITSVGQEAAAAQQKKAKPSVTGNTPTELDMLIAD